jgi:UDP-N-acetylglucosamine transferase subunit ALG13
MIPDPTGQRPLVLVTVGMDHHPFDRLMRWMESWLVGGGNERVRCLAQTGPAAGPRGAQCQEFLEYDELQSAMAAAAVVVCHAGPGTVMMCRWIGQQPIVIPRLARFGEVVDDHQVTFGRVLAQEGEAELAEDETTLHQLLDRALVSPGPRPLPVPEIRAVDSVLRFEELVDGILARRRQPGRGDGA